MTARRFVTLLLVVLLVAVGARLGAALLAPVLGSPGTCVDQTYYPDGEPAPCRPVTPAELDAHRAPPTQR